MQRDATKETATHNYNLGSKGDGSWRQLIDEKNANLEKLGACAYFSHFNSITGALDEAQLSKLGKLFEENSHEFRLK